MRLTAKISACQNHWNNLRKSQLVLIVLFSAALIIGQVLPMQASHIALGDSGWIEICGGEEGSYFIKADQDTEGSEQGHDCNDCSICTVAGGGANAAPVTSNEVFQLTVEMEIAFPNFRAVVAEHPEKHWSAARAPPIECIKRNTSFHDSIFLNRLYAEFFEDAPKYQVGPS